MTIQEHSYFFLRSDLYGTVGYPPKMTKTIIVGKDPTLVRQLLYILSYFIRCSEIIEYSLKMQIQHEMDSISQHNTGRGSCCSKTPTNTPSIEHWSNCEEGKENCGIDGNKDLETHKRESKKAFDDHEEICNCMCSVLQSIDYIGSKGLKNIKKITNGMRYDSSKHVESLKSKNTRGMNLQGHKNSINGNKNGIDSVADNNKQLNDNKRNYASFQCYCCPEKNNFRAKCIENMEQKYPRQDSDGCLDLTSPDDESKSCVCGERETSEYGSETRSIQCTLSRNSSCGSCSDYFRSQDLDSDYCSVAYEENGIDSNGIELDLQELPDDSVKSEQGEEDELLSLNLIDIPLPE